MYNKKDEKNTFAVYCHYFPNGKVYVGLTCNSNDVAGKRFGHDGCKYKDQPLVYRAIMKYGWDNIEHVIIAKYISRESAINIEKDLISLYQANNREHGYNISPGGEYGAYHSEESRKKMSEKRKGIKKSEEHKRKIGLANKGRKMSKDFCEKMAEIARNRHYNTDEDPRNIPIVQYRISDGKYIARYPSAAKAGRECGVSRAHIHECAKDNRRQVLDCVWIYEKDATEEYVQYRLNKARLNGRFIPVVISTQKDYSFPIYCETITVAAKYIGGDASSARYAIKNQTQYRGYYFKRISAEEYFDALNS